MPNYLGTATGFTGIPSLLISTLQQVQDQNVQRALYQIQNWANSFLTLNRGNVGGSSYTTGGIAVTFENPFTTDIDIVASAVGEIASIASHTLTGATVKLYNTNGSGELAAGSPYQFFYIAVGN